MLTLYCVILQDVMLMTTDSVILFKYIVHICMHQRNVI